MTSGSTMLRTDVRVALMSSRLRKNAIMGTTGPSTTTRITATHPEVSSMK
ncbi:MAG: hypothetical protein NUW23_02085 [Firmicutes bacterium]|nr:hypothetical protein [Bacillota bacterium]